MPNKVQTGIRLALCEKSQPLRKRPPVPTDVTRMPLGQRGTPPGQNFIYAHVNRVIMKYDFDLIDDGDPAA